MYVYHAPDRKDEAAGLALRLANEKAAMGAAFPQRLFRRAPSQLSVVPAIRREREKGAAVSDLLQGRDGDGSLRVLR